MQSSTQHTGWEQQWQKQAANTGPKSSLSIHRRKLQGALAGSSIRYANVETKHQSGRHYACATCMGCTNILPVGCQFLKRTCLKPALSRTGGTEDTLVLVLITKCSTQICCCHLEFPHRTGEVCPTYHAHHNGNLLHTLACTSAVHQPSFLHLLRQVEML